MSSKILEGTLHEVELDFSVGRKSLDFSLIFGPEIVETRGIEKGGSWEGKLSLAEKEALEISRNIIDFDFESALYELRLEATVKFERKPRPLDLRLKLLPRHGPAGPGRRLRSNGVGGSEFRKKVEAALWGGTEVFWPGVAADFRRGAAPVGMVGRVGLRRWGGGKVYVSSLRLVITRQGSILRLWLTLYRRPFLISLVAGFAFFTSAIFCAGAACFGAAKVASRIRGRDDPLELEGIKKQN